MMGVGLTQSVEGMSRAGLTSPEQEGILRSLPHQFFLVLQQAAFRCQLERWFSGALQHACLLCGFWTFSVIM